MKMKYSACIAIAVLCVAGHVSMSAADSSPVVITLEADFDGDKKVESAEISFVADEAHDYYETCSVRVGSSLVEALGEVLPGKASIVDVDRNDQWCEIAIPDETMSGVGCVYLLRYQRGQVRVVGHVPGAKPVIDGSGIIRTNSRGTVLCTWFYPSEYRWSDDAGAFTEIPQAFKPMKVNVTLKTDLDVSESARLPFRASNTLKAGTRAIIDLTDDVQWCRIRSSNGQSGWFFVTRENRLSNYDNAPHAQDVFDGLPLAN
jgi:hypothetical protein